MNLPFNDDLNHDNNYFQEIYPNVWLMDNHKWAFYIWEKYRQINDKIPSTLVHLDFHWDGVNDFKRPEDIERLINIDNYQKIFELISENRLVRYDSFIALAIIRGIIPQVHFFCLENEIERGIYEPFLKEYSAQQFFHESLDSLRKKIYGRPVILDIDLDLFNNSEIYYEGDLWEETDILNFIDNCPDIIKNSTVITIAMSFGYSGTKDDTRYLTQLAVPRIIEIYKQK